MGINEKIVLNILEDLFKLNENEKFAFYKNIFRIIGIKNKNVVEKDKFLFLELITKRCVGLTTGG